MNKILRAIFSLLLFLLNYSFYAQLNPDNLTHLDELDGTQIYDILPDRMGNIWIATQSGLVKFDGYDYTRYHPDLNDSTTMGELLTYSLLEDRNGYLWIGCMNAIYKYHPSSKILKRYLFNHLVGFPDYSTAGVAQIADDQNGRIYFGINSNNYTGTDALVYYDEAENRIKKFEYADNQTLSNIYGLSSGPDGSIWILSYGAFSKIDGAGMLHQLSIENFKLHKEEFLSGLTVDTSGTVWLATTHSRLFSYDPLSEKVESWSMQHLFDDGKFEVYARDLEVDPDHNIWISSNRGLVRFNPGESSFEIFEDDGDPLVREYIEAVSLDSFDNLWIGTETKGILKYSNKSIFESFTHDPNDLTSITSGWAHLIFEYREGKVLIVTSDGTENAGLNLFDTDTKNLTSLPYTELSPGISWYQVIGQTKPGELLVFTDLGLSIYNIHNRSLNDTTIEWLSEDIHIFNLARDNRNRLWFCTSDGLFTQDPLNSSIKHLDLSLLGDTVAAANEVTHIFEGPVHGLWILTNSGLYLYDYANDEVTRHAFDPNMGEVLSSQDINSLYEDRDGLVWVGTWQGGLCRYDPMSGKIKTYSINEGLPSTSIQGIIADQENDALWLSTFAGISRFDIKDEVFTNFSLSDGIQGLLYSDGSFLKTSNNYFIFGGNNGITWFNPDKISKKSHAPLVYITDFKVADQSIDFGIKNEILVNQTDYIKLSHHQNNISFEYTGIQYDNPSKNRFAYKLENYDDNWREVGNLRAAFYYALPPGNYVFRVKAANSNGVWNESGASIGFRISPPWWKTWWAYLIYGVMAVFAIVAIDRFQRRRLIEKAKREAKEKELEQAREIEKAYTQLKATQSQLVHAEKMASLGELTAGIAHEIQNPLNFVNNFSDLNAELLAELKEELEGGNINEVKAIANDLIENESKIKHHGTRADGIVKSMLQHSRSSGGEKIPTDLKALADEYLRLAYHGLRAKDKNFNANFKLEADENLPKVNIVPQDIGRVLLNLINNAFHAVSSKALATGDNSSKALSTEDSIYKPKVVVTLANSPLQGELRGATITVKDNGPGIPDEIKDKIFQPFFTTKASGEGTGLGLSLSYEIITKGHGGEISVETNNGTEFIINLPITK